MLIVRYKAFDSSPTDHKLPIELIDKSMEVDGLYFTALDGFYYLSMVSENDEGQFLNPLAKIEPVSENEINLKTVSYFFGNILIRLLAKHKEGEKQCLTQD